MSGIGVPFASQYSHTFVPTRYAYAVQPTTHPTTYVSGHNFSYNPTGFGVVPHPHGHVM